MSPLNPVGHSTRSIPCSNLEARPESLSGDISLRGNKPPLVWYLELGLHPLLLQLCTPEHR